MLKLQKVHDILNDRAADWHETQCNVMLKHLSLQLI